MKIRFLIPVCAVLFGLPHIDIPAPVTPELQTVPYTPEWYETETEDFVAVPEPIDADEHTCLALNIYHEARGETLEGRIAIADVTLARVDSKSYPNTICEVVWQKRCNLKHAAHNGCTAQFSWTWDGKDDTPTETESWEEALDIAEHAMRGYTPDVVGGAMFYHAKRVSPRWARKLVKVKEVGKHIFYRKS